MKILVKASGPPSTEQPYCNYAVYTLGPEEKRLLKARRTIFGDAQEHDKDLYQLTFFGSFVVFYDNMDISEFLSKKDIDRLEADDYLRLPDNFTTWREESKTEMELLVIAEDGFFCTAIPKYLNYTVETTGLGYNVLDSIPIIDIEPDPTKFDTATGKRKHMEGV